MNGQNRQTSTPPSLSGEQPIILIDTDEGYADDWVWIEATAAVPTEQAAREWAKGSFLNDANEEVVATGPVTQVWLRRFNGDDDRWFEGGHDDVRVRCFWKVDVSV